MNQGQLARALTQGNAWWRTAGWERDDRDLRRLASSRLGYAPAPLADIVAGGVYVLRGPRRVGKSLEIKRCIADLIRSGVAPRRIIHFACDELGRGDLRRLVAAGRDTLTRGVTEPRYWFLDEITSVPDWPATLKWLRDNTALQDDCVVLTGSSARDLADAQKQLAGRLGPPESPDRLLLPMSFRAFARAVGMTDVLDVPALRPKDFQTRDADAAIDELQVWLDDLLSAWELYLLVGGFPRAVADYLEHGDVQVDFTRALWDVVAGEAIRGANVSATQTQALLVRLTKNLASPLNLTEVARDIGVDSPHTSRARVQDLILAYLAWPCHQLGDHDLPRLGAQSKIYFTDPLLARLAHIRSDTAPIPDASQLSEQQLGLALLRCVERQEPGTFAEFRRIMVGRSTRKEIDFVGPPIGQAGFEGKYVDDGWRQEALTVKARYGRGVLATRTVVDTTGPVWAVPAPIVAWLLNA